MLSNYSRASQLRLWGSSTNHYGSFSKSVVCAATFSGLCSKSDNSSATASPRLHSARLKVQLCTDMNPFAADRPTGPSRVSEPTSPPALWNYSRASQLRLWGSSTSHSRSALPDSAAVPGELCSVLRSASGTRGSVAGRALGGAAQRV